MSSATTEQVIVADSSPLIGLARIGRLDLLRRSASRIILPPAVWDEVTSQSYQAPGSEAIKAASWLEIVTPQNSAAIASLKMLVDRGEAEAIALAQSTESCLLLVDDSRARRVAQQLEVRVLGTIGLLRRSLKAGWIPKLRPELEALQSNGIYIRQKLFDMVLADVGE